MRWLAIGITAAAVVLTGCEAGVTEPAAETLTLHIDIGDDPSKFERECALGGGRYAEIGVGMPIVVTSADAPATVLGSGRIVGVDQDSWGKCRFTGSVEGLPREDGTVYTIGLGESGFELTYSYEQMEAKNWTLDVAMLANLDDWTVRSDAGEPTSGMGEPAQAGDYEFVVRSVTCGEPTAGADMWFVVAKGQLCRLKVTMTNTGDQPVDRPMTHYLIDGTNRQVDTSPDAMFAEINTAMRDGGEDPWLTPLNPGDQMTADILFDVPWDFEPVKVELAEGGPSFDQSVVVALT